MTEQTVRKQITREYYNVLYGAKIHFASFDICEKLPTVISVISLSFGVLGLAYAEFNSKALAVLLLLIGIIGIVLKPREALKEQYNEIGSKLTTLSKRLEILFGEIDEQDQASIQRGRDKLSQIQSEHSQVVQLAPVMLSSWYAHYKVFSEHNSGWMCKELNLKWTDKVPLSLRMTLLALFIIGIIWIDPYCLVTKSWTWVSEPCVGCWQELPSTVSSVTSH